MPDRTGHGPSQGAAEQPSRSASLELHLVPTKLVGTVPSHHAPVFITTIGLVGCGVAGIGGAVLTLRASPASTDVAYAELTLALALALLIVLCALIAAGRKGKRRARRGSRELPEARAQARGKGS